MRNKSTGRIGEQNHSKLIAMIDDKLTANEIAEKLNVNPETVRKFARKRGLKIQRQNMGMENHPSWSGGLTVDRSGYILKRVPVDSEYGYLIRALAKRGEDSYDTAGYAPVHRIVMHQKAGRKLRRGEVVDHIDGNVQNNAPSNLRLFPSNAEHLRVTLKGKIPNWSAAGRARITGRPPKNRPK